MVLENTMLRQVLLAGQTIDIEVHPLGAQYCGPHCSHLNRAYRANGIGWDCRAFRSELTLVQLPVDPANEDALRCVARYPGCVVQEVPERAPERIETHADLQQAFRRLDQVWDARPGHPQWEERERLIAMVSRYEDTNVADPPPPDPRDAAIYVLERSQLEETHIQSLDSIVQRWRRTNV